MTSLPVPSAGRAVDHAAPWLYGLPGSGVTFRQTAGAPSLEELEELEPGPTGEKAGIWICYGSLAWGLTELVDRLQPVEMEAALERWQADLIRAAALKRRWREGVRLLNCSRGGARLAAELARELPELQPRGHRSDSGTDAAMEVAMRALLQSRPLLLKAWLEAEHWADAGGVKSDAADPRHGPEVDWRQPMPLSRLLSVLWPSDGRNEVSRAQLQDRCAELEQALERERQHGEMLQRYQVQMEQELDHYVAEYERAATLAERLSELLRRARRVIAG